MFYIFNKDNTCIGRCDIEPNLEDLELRDEFCVESSESYNTFTLTYDDDFVVTEHRVVDDTAKKEHSWVRSELKLVDTELMYHWTGDITRQSYTEQDWKLYAIALRDYTTLVDGIPVVNSESRPISPRNTTLEE